MKTPLLIWIGLAGCAALATAQTKTMGTGMCTEKPDKQEAVAVGDRPNHSAVLVHQKCTWTTPMEMEGLKSTTYSVTVLSDSSGAKSQDRGYVVVDMDNGDKAFVRFMGTSVMKDGKGDSDEGTWSYTGGTGKLKGITGKGTYKGKAAANGFQDDIEGEYAITPPKAKK